MRSPTFWRARVRPTSETVLSMLKEYDFGSAGRARRRTSRDTVRPPKLFWECGGRAKDDAPQKATGRARRRSAGFENEITPTDFGAQIRRASESHARRKRTMPLGNVVVGAGVADNCQFRRHNAVLGKRNFVARFGRVQIWSQADEYCARRMGHIFVEPWGRARADSHREARLGLGTIARPRISFASH